MTLSITRLYTYLDPDCTFILSCLSSTADSTLKKISKMRALNSAVSVFHFALYETLGGCASSSVRDDHCWIQLATAQFDRRVIE